MESLLQDQDRNQDQVEGKYRDWKQDQDWDQDRDRDQDQDMVSVSCVSLKSSQSMLYPLGFKGNPSDPESGFTPYSVRSTSSMLHPPSLSGETQPDSKSEVKDDSSMLYHPSLCGEKHQDSKREVKDDVSMFQPMHFNGHQPEPEREEEPEEPEEPEGLEGPEVSEGPQWTGWTGSPLISVLMENLNTILQELEKIRRSLRHQEASGSLDQVQEASGSLDRVQKAMENIRSHLGMSQQSIPGPLSESRTRLQSILKERSRCVFEGIPKHGECVLLDQVYTEIHLTEGGTTDLNEEHEVRQIETKKPARPERPIRLEDIFKGPPGGRGPIRTVMTKGVAGIGKTILTQKFTLDWAEGKTNQDIPFLFPFTFRELNVMKEKKFSLMELLHHFFPEVQPGELKDNQVVFILDGLDECRLLLDFSPNKILTDVTESTSLDVLLTNLIRGNLLPSALLWITTRPAAANQIPPECVDMVTEVRGFTDPQKEDYFRKRFRDQEQQANRIISHIKTSRSLHIMCHIPIFCWMTATVLEDMLKTREGGELPKTLTQMYIYFLVVQSRLQMVKYDGGSETDPTWSPKTREMIESLAKLAFDQLQRDNLIFYESDLTECGIDIKAASKYSGVFTQVFREERGLYQDQVFCFVHLSVQEFLAALHVHLTFINSGVNLLEDQQTPSEVSGLRGLHRCAVDKALQSPNGHLDLFLRFLLGLSLENNQSLLGGLLKRSESHQETVEYIKEKLNEDVPPERSINLFHCLNELNDGSLVEQVQLSMTSGCLSTRDLSPGQWSALNFFLLSPEEDLDVFDLTKFSASEEALLRLLPVVQASKSARLSGCNLSGRSCAALSSILSSPSCRLQHLDLSNNNLEDSGLELLFEGLQSPHCRLEALSLSGCLITEVGFSALASVLKSNPRLRDLALDLSYNHPGDSGVQLLSEGLGGPQRLNKTRLYPGGKQWLKEDVRKYACELKLDPDSANRNLFVYNHQEVLVLLDPDQDQNQDLDRDPGRFVDMPQLQCEWGLSGRSYWEVEWREEVNIAVTYTGKGDHWFGSNRTSWSLYCSQDQDQYQYYAFHDRTWTLVQAPPCASNRVGVYLDWPAGTLSFYSVSDEGLVHLHTFCTTFTELVYPAFGFFRGPGSSLSLVQTSRILAGPGKAVDLQDLPVPGPTVDLQDPPVPGPTVDLQDPPVPGKAVDLQDLPVPGPDLQDPPDLQDLPASGPAVDLQDPPVPDPDLQDLPVPGPTVDLQDPPVPDPDLHDLLVPGPAVDLQDLPVPGPTVDLQDPPLPGPTVDLQDPPVPVVDLQDLPVPVVDLQDPPVPGPAVNLQDLPVLLLTWFFYCFQ